MIANCPSCGTHYKHQPPKAPVTVRCGRCDTALDLTRFRPYRIVQAPTVTTDDAKRTATYLQIGLDHPNLAATIAVNVAERVPTLPPSHADWGRVDPVQQIPASAPMVASGEGPVPQHVEPRRITGEPETATETAETETAAPIGWVGFVLWTATAAAAGIAASWSMVGTAPGGLAAGMAAGAAIGAAARWGWRRWTSPR